LKKTLNKAKHCRCARRRGARVSGVNYTQTKLNILIYYIKKIFSFAALGLAIGFMIARGRYGSYPHVSQLSEQHLTLTAIVAGVFALLGLLAAVFSKNNSGEKD